MARAVTEYQLAATELALVHQRAERGVIDVARFDGRCRDLLALMATARDAFVRQHAGQGSPPWARHRHSGFGYGRPPAQPG